MTKKLVELFHVLTLFHITIGIDGRTDIWAERWIDEQTNTENKQFHHTKKDN